VRAGRTFGTRGPEQLGKDEPGWLEAILRSGSAGFQFSGSRAVRGRRAASGLGISRDGSAGSVHSVGEPARGNAGRRADRSTLPELGKTGEGRRVGREA